MVPPPCDECLLCKGLLSFGDGVDETTWTESTSRAKRCPTVFQGLRTAGHRDWSGSHVASGRIVQDRARSSARVSGPPPSRGSVLPLRSAGRGCPGRHVSQHRECNVWGGTLRPTIVCRMCRRGTLGLMVRAMPEKGETLSLPQRPRSQSAGRAACLFLEMESGRPLAGPSRYFLDGVTRILLERGHARWAAVHESELLVQVPDYAISSKHAEIRREGAGWRLKDLGSRNGTFVDSKRVEERILPDRALVQ